MHVSCLFSLLSFPVFFFFILCRFDEKIQSDWKLWRIACRCFEGHNSFALTISISMQMKSIHLFLYVRVWHDYGDIILSISISSNGRPLAGQMVRILTSLKTTLSFESQIVWTAHAKKKPTTTPTDSIDEHTNVFRSIFSFDCNQKKTGRKKEQQVANER